VAKKKSTVQTM